MTSVNRCRLCVLLLQFLFLGTLTSAFGQITPSQDANTNTAFATTNYGTATTLGLVSSATSIQTTYIRFDLTSIPAGYTSANIAKATLKLYVNSVTTAGSFNVDFVNGSWSEKSITASLAPALGTTIVTSVPLISSNVHGYVLIDVTAAVGDWLNGSQVNDGIALVANSPLSATFDSKESSTQSQPAELDIVFTSGGTITGVTTASGSGLAGGGTSGTLNLSLQSCSTNQVLQWNGSAWACAPVGTGTINGVTAGTGLTGGGNLGNVMLNLDTTQVPLLSGTNSFTGNQNVTGNVAATGSISGATATFSGIVTEGGALLPAGGLATSSQGFDSQPMDVVTSVYNSHTAAAQNQDFRWLAEPVGNNTSSPSGKLNLLFGANGATPAETGFSVASNGQITFASGQTFPGTSSITGITTASGSGLSGGGTSGALNLSLTNTCSSSQVLQWNGSAWVCASTGTGTISGVTAGADLTGGGNSGNVTLNLDATKVPLLNAANNFTGNQSITGTLTAAVSGGTGNALFGAADTMNGVGAYSQQGEGVHAYSIYNTGVYGISTGVLTAGVYGQNDSSAAMGVEGESANGLGVYGLSTSNTGVYGQSTSFAGVIGDSQGAGVGGVIGINNAGTTSMGVQGKSASGYAIYGESTSGFGVYGFSAQSSAIYGVSDGWYGAYFSGAGYGGGVFATTTGGGDAGDFNGNLDVTGTITAGAKDFKIDHPLDPANQYLYHASVESSEMKNIYDGMVTLDANGEARVDLPAWFEALNGDFRYQLTAVGAPASGLYIAEEISNHQFSIAGGPPNRKVSWQVTGVRRDAYAKAHPLLVEVDKPQNERGYYIHPELHGATDEDQINWARNPEKMRRIKELQQNRAKSTTAPVQPKPPVQSGFLQADKRPR